MADDEQFSLCWNNFNSNLSAGFHESLCRGDLVDVTLAAEGQFVKAHRLVLSVCSPYFRKMFTQMPANQHAFVFLKDVSHTALKDLIQFMYCGEVNVKQEALPAFISTAEALQIKGLTDSDPSSQSPAEPAAPQPPIPQVTPPRVRQNQRTSSTRSYKIETVDDSLDEKQPTQIVIQTTPSQSTTIAQSQQHLQQNQHHPTQQIASTGTTTTVVTSHKRPAPRTIGTAPHIKRTKSTIDPLEASEPNTQQITVQATVVSADSKVQQQQQHTEAEYIDLPIELPTKSEPDYSEDAGDVDAVENEATYVDDESYGDMRYDESYFTENEEGPSTAAVTGSVGSSSATTSKALVKTQQSLSESSYVEAGDQTNNDAQDTSLLTVQVRKRGRPKTKEDVPPPGKLIDKLHAAVSNSVGLPALYASTTKGGMKLVYEGHHFRYSFRKGQFSIFQCCYKENREECKVRVVSDQRRVYPLDGEHIHFVQATDKSVTSVRFEPGTLVAEVGVLSTTSACDTDNKTIPEKEIMLLHLGKTETYDEDEQCFEAEEEEEAESEAVDPNDFREKIKKRLQKALLGKKK